MLSQNFFRLMMYTAVVVLLLIPLRRAESANIKPIYKTETPSYQLYYFWDLRDRESYFQVSNLIDSEIKVHIQIFNANDDCFEFDFYDTYTPLDAHLYNLGAMDSNDGVVTGGEFPAFGKSDFGFVVVTVVNSDFTVRRNPIITGSFRIFDLAGGYEYGAKAAGFPTPPIQIAATYELMYNALHGTNRADVVGIAVQGAGTATVIASPSINAIYNPVNLDLNEVLLSCAPVTFACDSEHFDYGINDVIQNSRDLKSICPGMIDEGKVVMRSNKANATFFVGFIGINNSEGLGNMTTFTAYPFFRFAGFLTVQ
jgi:hypothetical protein